MSSLRAELQANTKMDTETDKTGAADREQADAAPVSKLEVQADELPVKALTLKSKKQKKSSKRHPKQERTDKADAPRKSKKATRKVSRRGDAHSSDSSSDSSADDSDSDDGASEQDKKRPSKSRSGKSTKQRRQRKSRKHNDTSDDDSASDSDDPASASSDGGRSANRRKKTHSKRSRKAESESEDEPSDERDDKNEFDALEEQARDLMARISELKSIKPKSAKRQSSSKASKNRKSSRSKKSTSADSLQYKRVDQLWDSTIHNYKLKESVEDEDEEFAEYAFLVRRCFDWENKYQSTTIDIKSSQLRSALAEVMKECKSISLEAEEPSIDPNILFLYLEQLRTFYKKTLKTRIKAERKKKAVKKLEQQRSLCRTLVSYIDDDYAETKKTLYPMLKAGYITFDLLWALFMPNDIVITSCYGVWDEPRCFKVDYANKFKTMTRGEWYCIEGKYLEYDGKGFGYGEFEVDVDSFKGKRKINSLAAYPLKYHRDPEGVQKQIIARGERFVSLDGMQYKFHKGLAFMKKKRQVLKININGRVMVDPATFRRINPNYPISLIKSKDDDLVSDSDSDCSCCAPDSDDDDAIASSDERLESPDDDEDDHKDGDDDGDHSDHTAKYKYKWVEDGEGEHYVKVEVDDNGDPIQTEVLDRLGDNRTFTKEQLLLASPVVVGFAFSEKLWLEFTLSGVHEITYNDAAFDSLVLPPNQKSIVRALVESHKFHAARTIDDVIQGKGKGLVSVLHGPPGTGKTLTAEGISELLRCPLYMVSVGELGTDPARLEQELQKILDIAHSWGAVLLLDEADVFLEKREVHDIHRNALVSIFLRLLEYFQGILFLTTNRVETFDDAFQSRIHVALRYGELTTQARKSVWTMFLDMVRKNGDPKIADFTDHELDSLARRTLNGRQIKNMVRTAQALALNERQMLTMEHLRRVLDVAETFDRDLKGGTGYIDAMRSYT